MIYYYPAKSSADKLELAHEVEKDQCQLQKTEKGIWAGQCGKNMYRLEQSIIITYDANLIQPTLIQGPIERWVCFTALKFKTLRIIRYEKAV